MWENTKYIFLLRYIDLDILYFLAGAEPAARAQPRAVRVPGAGRGGALLGVPLGGGGGARAHRHRRHHHRERRPGPRRLLPRARLLPRRGRGALPQDRGQRIQVHIPHSKVIIIIHQMKHFRHHDSRSMAQEEDTKKYLFKMLQNQSGYSLPMGILI